MPYIISMLWGALALTLQSFVGKILIYLGISYLTYQGIDVLIGSIEQQVNQALGQSAGTLNGLIGLTRLGESTSVILSALTAKYTLAGLQGGSLTRQVFK